MDKKFISQHVEKAMYATLAYESVNYREGRRDELKVRVGSEEFPLYSVLYALQQQLVQKGL